VRSPKTVRYQSWPEAEALRVFEELREKNRELLSEDGWPCLFVEVTVGRRSAGGALMALELAQEPVTSNASSRVRDEVTARFWGVPAS
jgi:hypothetical protein